MHRCTLPAFAIALVVLSAGACADAAAPRDQLASLRIAPGLSVLAAGDSALLSIDLIGENGQPDPGAGITLASSDTSVARVQDRYAIAASPGVATIVATSAAATDSAVVAVVSSGGAALLLTDASHAASLVAEGDSLVVTLSLVAPNGASASVASLGARIQWDPARLTYRASSSADASWFWLPNEDAAATGRLNFVAFSVEDVTTPIAVARLVFGIPAPIREPTRIDVNDASAGTASGVDVSSAIVPVPTIVSPH